MLTLTKDQWSVYEKRNIEYYVANKFFGVHRLKSAMGRGKTEQIFLPNFVKKIYKFFVRFLSCFVPILRWRKAFRQTLMKFADGFVSAYHLEKLRLKIAFKFGKIYIPQVEFAITTQCNLKCKHCTNYIPYLTRQRTINLPEFRLYLDNFLANVAKLNSLLLLGGEPLLNKDLPQILAYSLEHKKIENVYITTNGTINFRDELKSVILQSKYKNKLWVWVSNYTANEKLAKRLKSFEILEWLKANNINYIFIKDSWWGESLPPTYFERTDEENSAYFLSCNTPCVSVYGEELSICPRASHFALQGTIVQKDNERLMLGGGGDFQSPAYRLLHADKF